MGKREDLMLRGAVFRRIILTAGIFGNVRKQLQQLQRGMLRRVEDNNGARYQKRRGGILGREMAGNGRGFPKTSFE